MESGLRVVVLGAASIDIKGRACEPLLPLTSNPGTVKLSVGGVARNTAENLARLGIQAILLSVVGSDIFGDTILTQTMAAGVNCDHVIVSPDLHSGAYFALFDEAGQLVVSIDDMDSLAALTPDYLAEKSILFYGADMIVLDGNVPPPTIASVIRLAHLEGIPVCVDPTSVLLAPRFEPYLADIDLIMPNIAEAQVYCNCDVAGRDDAIAVARQLVRRGVNTAIVTLGADGVAYATSDESGWIPAFPIPEVTDPTGGGDALTAGIVFGLLNNVPIDEAARLGASAAALTLQSPETVRPDLNLDLLYEQLMVF